jgi:hypothetical protein
MLIRGLLDASPGGITAYQTSGLKRIAQQVPN